MRIILLLFFLISCAKEIKPNLNMDEDKEVLSEIKKLVLKDKFYDAEKKLYLLKNETNETLDLKSKIYFQVSDFQKAEIAFKKILENDKSEINYLKYLNFLVKINKDKESLELISELIEISNKNQVYKFKKAILLKKQNQITASQEILLSLESYSNLFQLNLHIADNFYILKNYKEAEKFFLKAKSFGELSEEEIGILNSIRYIQNLNRGIEFAKKEEFDLAIKELLEAEKISSEDILPKFTLGNIYLKKKDYNKSEEYFLRTIDLKPNFKEAYFNLAKLYLEIEDLNKTKEILAKAEKKIQENSELSNLKGMYYFKNEEFKKSSLQFLKSIELNPKELKPRYNLVLIYILENRFSEAKFEVEKLKLLFPKEKEVNELSSFLESEETESQFLKISEEKEIETDKIDILESLALHHFYKKSFQKSELYFLKLLDKSNTNEYKIYLARIYNLTNNPKKENFLYLKDIKGIFLEDEEKFIQAIKFYEKNSNNRNKISELYLKLAKLELEKNSIKDSEEYLLQAKKFYDSQKLKSFESILLEKKESIEFKSANQLFKEKEYLKALIEFQKILDSRNLFQVRKKIFQCYKNLNQIENSIQFLKDSIQKNKQNSNYYKIELGKIYSETKNQNKAIEIFDEILKENPEEEIVYHELGLVYLEIDLFKSKLNFDKSLNLNPKNSKSYLGRGISKYRLGSRDDARIDFEKSIFYSKNKFQAKLNLGIFCINEFNFEEANSIFKELYHFKPNDQNILYNLSFIYFKKENYSESEEWILKSLKQSRDKKNLLAYQKILSKLGKFSEQKKIEEELLEKFSEKLNNQNLEKILPRESLGLNPILVQGNLILNYKNSIELYETKKNRNKWRVEFSEEIKKIDLGDSIYVQTANFIYKIDLNTGEEIFKLKRKAKEIFPHQFGFYIQLDSRLESFDTNFKLNGELNFNANKKISVNEFGDILFSHLGDREIQFQIFDLQLNKINEFELIGPNILSYKRIFSIKNNFYFLIENSFYQINRHNLEKILDISDNLKIFKSKNKIYIHKNQKVFEISLEEKKLIELNLKIPEFKEELIFGLLKK